MSTAKIKIKQQHSAGGVLIKDNRVLLIHWDPPRDSYDFPKGGIRWFESAKKACQREFLEETGYKVIATDFIGSNGYTYDWMDGKKYSKTVQYFLVELSDEKQYPTRHEAYETFQNAWVNLDDALTTITRDINKEIMQRAIEMTSSQ